MSRVAFVNAIIPVEARSLPGRSAWACCFPILEATSLGRIFWRPRLQELGTLVSKLLFVLSLHLLVTKLSPPHLLALLT
jgi:hypothetical protein